MDAEERRRIVREIRERAAEAAISHTLSDDESELALLGMGLADEFDALERLERNDPVGVAMFGDRPDWWERQLARLDAPK
jgi:hypothetical protein